MHRAVACIKIKSNAEKVLVGVRLGLKLLFLSIAYGCVRFKDQRKFGVPH
jgi:hypothetical protein